MAGVHNAFKIGEAMREGKGRMGPSLVHAQNSYKIQIFDFPLTSSRFTANQDLLLRVLGLSQSDQG